MSQSVAGAGGGIRGFQDLRLGGFGFIGTLLAIGKDGDAVEHTDFEFAGDDGGGDHAAAGDGDDAPVGVGDCVGWGIRRQARARASRWSWSQVTV